MYNIRRQCVNRHASMIFQNIVVLNLLRYRGCRGGCSKQRPIKTINNTHRPIPATLTPCNSLPIVHSPGLCQRISSSSIGNKEKNLISISPVKSFCKNVNISLQNVRSARNKSASICDSIESLKTDIFIAIEVWHEPNDKALISSITPNGYNSIDKARSVGNRNVNSMTLQNYGGIAIIYRSVFCVQNILLSLDITTFEYICCRVKSTSSVFILVAIYRPGSKAVSQKFFNELTTLFESLVTHRCPVIVTGDFNIRVDRPGDSSAVRFAELLASFDLVQHVKSPTHDLGGTLDLVITKSEDKISNTIVQLNGLSDHSLIHFNIDVSTVSQNSNEHLTRQWRSFDLATFDNDLYDLIDLRTNEKSLDICTLDELCDLYHSSITTVLNQHAPLARQKRCPRRLTPWFDDDCRAAKRRARRLERKYRKSSTAVDRRQWIEELRRTSKTYENKRNVYWSAKFVDNKLNPRKLWRSLKSFMGRMGSPSPVLGGLSADDLSQFFRKKIQDVADSTASSNPPTFQSSLSSDLSSFTPLTIEDTLKLLADSPSKQCSLDPAPTWIIKGCILSLAPLLTEILNRSLVDGCFPSSHKSALVYPLLKKEGLDSHDVKNYRPISNLSFLSKLIERAVCSQIRSYLEGNNLLPRCQSAYRQSHSTETALLKVYSEFVCAIDRGEISLLGLLDMSCAFDTVDHQILLQRLHADYGFSDKVLTWITSYLSGRTQTVVVDDKRSSTECLERGVPQGSVLGPILFILYTADVLKIITKHGLEGHAYADDTQMYFHSSPDQVNNYIPKVMACIKEINEWMTSNRLRLNPDKTEFIWFASNYNLKHASLPMQLKLVSDDIMIEDSIRDLGVYFDSMLTLNSNVSKVLRICFYELRQLRYLSRSLSNCNVKMLLHALISSRLDYCNSIYAGQPDTLLQKLQSVQNAAARLYGNLSRRTHVTETLRDELHWLRIPQRINYKLCVLVYRCLHGTAPPYLSENIVRLQDFDDRIASNRSASLGNLLVPRTRTKSYGSRCFHVAGPNAWNSLPTYLKTEMPFDAFKSLLKTYYFRQCYDL